MQVRVYYPKGYVSIFYQRTSIDNNYYYFYIAKTDKNQTHGNISHENIGISTLYFVNTNLNALLGFTYNKVRHPHYENNTVWRNYQVQVSAKYIF